MTNPMNDLMEEAAEIAKTEILGDATEEVRAADDTELGAVAPGEASDEDYIRTAEASWAEIQKWADGTWSIAGPGMIDGQLVQHGKQGFSSKGEAARWYCRVEKLTVHPGGVRSVVEVTETLASALAGQDEAVAEWQGRHFWGRTETNEDIHEDRAITRIAARQLAGNGHPAFERRTTKEFEARSPLAHLVHQTLGWRFEGAVQVRSRRKGEIVEVTGTLLKPEEWRVLARSSGTILPDGRTMKVTGVPDEIRHRR